ncbi:F-box/kelch-repeat protein At3g23880-like [Camellia sinensis]|uniref:F-box/kelch-repeat protein At3g23880-like n=1 Tax=Camellia sinensis TaxID=4442 RepID=UPI001035A205|nr:F-box/kelch-repeat protein At3g23880-like [Camellia sinensis]
MKDHQSIYRSLKSCFLHLIVHEPYVNMVCLDYPSKTLLQDVGIGGSCDGMVVRIGFANGSLEVKIYSLRTNSWKKIQDFPSNIIGFHSMDSGKLVNGSLNWVGTNPSNQSWVMNEYGRKESWTKFVCMPYLPKKILVLFSQPLWYLKDGGMLVNCTGTLVLCDLIEHTFKQPVIYGVPYFHQVEVYVESLVSPNAFMKMPTDLNN